jgi:hypothetical protein
VEERSPGLEPISNNEEGLMELIYDLFKAFACMCKSFDTQQRGNLAQ